MQTILLLLGLLMVTPIIIKELSRHTAKNMKVCPVPKQYHNYISRKQTTGRQYHEQ